MEKLKFIDESEFIADSTQKKRILLSRLRDFMSVRLELIFLKKKLGVYSCYDDKDENFGLDLSRLICVKKIINFCSKLIGQIKKHNDDFINSKYRDNFYYTFCIKFNILLETIEKFLLAEELEEHIFPFFSHFENQLHNLVVNILPINLSKKNLENICNILDSLTFFLNYNFRNCENILEGCMQKRGSLEEKINKLDKERNFYLTNFGKIIKIVGAINNVLFYHDAVQSSSRRDERDGKCGISLRLENSIKFILKPNGGIKKLHVQKHHQLFRIDIDNSDNPALRWIHIP